MQSLGPATQPASDGWGSGTEAAAVCRGGTAWGAGERRKVGYGLPAAQVGQEAGRLSLGSPEVQGVPPPAAHVSGRSNLERPVAAHSDDEEPPATLRHAIVSGEQDVLGHGVTQLAEGGENLVAELALLPLRHARHVLQQEGA